ncbi:MAG: 30S ribosomal protein S10 [Candidatus Njordarchaeota archaeon]
MQRRRYRRPYRRPQPRKTLKRVYIRLIGLNHGTLDSLCETIVKALKSRHYNVSFVRLPTKRLWIHTRRTPCGQGSETFDHYVLNIHRRLIVCEISPRDLTLIASLPVPNDVWVQLRIPTS